jgi:hypothetical protein
MKRRTATTISFVLYAILGIVLTVSAIIHGE